MQHLLDAATVPLPIPICASMFHVVNLLAAGKAPQRMSVYLAGGNYTALSKNKPNCPIHVWPIAVWRGFKKAYKQMFKLHHKRQSC